MKLLFAVFFCLTAEAQSNVDLMIAVRQKENGVKSESIYILRLEGWNDDYTLTSLTLNPDTRNGTLYSGVEVASTREENLRVYKDDDEIRVEEDKFDIGGQSSAWYVFHFLKDKSLKTAFVITDFSGGFIKNSILLKKILTVEYTPITDSFTTKLNCNKIGIPYVHLKKEK